MELESTQTCRSVCNVSYIIGLWAILLYIAKNANEPIIDRLSFLCFVIMFLIVFRIFVYVPFVLFVFIILSILCFFMFDIIISYCHEKRKSD